MGISPIKCDISLTLIMCHITTVVSGAVSLGVLAGVLSGIVYIVLIGLKWAGKLKLSLEEEALKGRKEDNFLTGNLCIKCRHHHNGSLSNGSLRSEQYENFSCSGSVCSGSGNHVSKRGSRRISENWSEDKDMGSPGSEDSNDLKTVRIREEIEKLVEEMVGGSLDGVSVGKLSENRSYLAMFAKHHEPLCQELAKLGYALHVSLNRNGLDVDSPDAVQSTLKSLVEKVIAEAMKLPNIKEIVHSQSLTEEIINDNSFSNKSYEDILATAILNKVIEQCQKRQQQSNKKKHKKSEVKNVRNRNNNIICYEEDEDDDILYNSDWSGTSRSEQLSLTIEEHIEEITTTYENSEEDEFSEEVDFNSAIPFPESGRVILNGEREDSEGEGDTHSSMTELISTGNSWEENWLFQRKTLRSGGKSHHPVPVPMLVPNPSQDFRALIGGVDADDLSDMSECSDSLLEEVVLASDERAVEEAEEDFHKDEENEIIKIQEGEENGMSLNSESSCPSLSQKERDVSFDYECFQKCDIEIGDPTRTSESSDTVKREYNQPVKCRIAEREKEKWNNPIELANNPYSAENILKREQRKSLDYFRTGSCNVESLRYLCDSPAGITTESTKEIHSRDYYIKASRCPTGDPTFRSTPEKYEPLVEVSDQLERRNRYSFSKWICDCSNEKPIQGKSHSLKRSKNYSKSFCHNSMTENSFYKCCSLRLPSERRRRSTLNRRIGELSDLEEMTLKENIAHVVFRAKNATPNFIINPLFEDNGKELSEKEGNSSNVSLQSDADGYNQQKLSKGHESGYGSDAHDCSSDSSEFWRLTPPETPEMLESSLITAFELRRKNCGIKTFREKRFFDTFPKSRKIHYY